MVDDPSVYVDVLRADPKLRRKAEAALKARLKLWQEARTLAEKAKEAGLPVPQPGPAPTLDDMLADQERQRLFRIIEDLVLWENTTNEKVLQAARDEIWQSWRRTCAENADHPRAKELFDRHKLPAFHDPFAGGGSLPLEAQRLGLESYASDLNPVAVLINKALIEIPPKFAGMPPVNPESRTKLDHSKSWRGAQGLAEDVRYYGQWMRDEAERRIGHLYPKIEITAEMAKERSDLKKYVGQKLTVIAWLWARTVKSPNPAFAQIEVPLTSTFMLSTKGGKEAYVEPLLAASTALQPAKSRQDGGAPSGYRFAVKVGKPKDAEAAKNGTKRPGANFVCVMSGSPITGDYIKSEAQAGRMGTRMMAIVAEGERGRVYLSPNEAMEDVAREAKPEWKPEVEFLQQALGFRVGNYGMTKWSDLFTRRQIVALTTFSDLVQEARERVRHNADVAAKDGGAPSEGGNGLAAGGSGATAYADAVGVYLGCVVSAVTDDLSSIVTWRVGHGTGATRSTFARQALPMVWDFAEANPFASAAGDLLSASDAVARVVAILPPNGSGQGTQADAVGSTAATGKRVVSTDPPYYDNIGYADLSDFFYVWLRRSLKPVFPDLFATVAVPKTEELVATPFRHGGKEQAEAFFVDGMTKAMRRLAEQTHPAFPVTIFYAFKQAETESEGEGGGMTSTGWDTFLEGVIRAGFSTTGTWPMRTERGARSRGIGSNALASSIVLVCRPRAADASTATRREFVTALKAELPKALILLQRGNIAPVDLAQAAIGPGMAVYTRYAKVLDAEGKPLAVREALALINQTLDEVLAEQEGDFDADSRWALAWFADHGFTDGPFGDAHTYFLRFNTAENVLKQSGIIESGRGKVRLLKPDELPSNWDPTTDARLTAWEMVHHLIRVLEAGGESGASALAAKLGSKAEIARELCYRLYTLCEHKKRAAEALSYNGLVQSWPEITRLAREEGAAAQQPKLPGTE
jgi:putative DNA methylase